MSPFKDVTEFNKSFNKSMKDRLLEDAKQAIGWGMPDHWSTGMTNSELIKIISRLVKYIEAQ